VRENSSQPVMTRTLGIAGLILFWTTFVAAEAILGPAAMDVGEYRVGVGDVLRIHLFDGKESLEQVARVRPDGKISADLAGSVHVQDFTPTQIGEVLKLRLKKYYRTAEITVFVDEFASQKVLVIGNVKTPGNYALMGEDRVLDVLARAGWLAVPVGEGTDRVVLLRDNARENLSITEMLGDAKLDQNRVLRKGDILHVMSAAEKGMVRVQGEIKSPGKVWIERDPMWVTDALTAVGGLTDAAEPTKAFVVRTDGVQIPFNLEEVLNGKRAPNAAPRLRDGDLLYVPHKTRLRVYVIGMVRSPGQYELPGSSHVLAAIARAGYHVPGAVLDSTRVVRVSPTGQTHVFQIALEKLLLDRQFQNDIELEDGDVVYVPKSVISGVGDFWEKIWPLVRVNIQNLQAPAQTTGAH